MADRRDEHRLVLWDIDHTLIETRGVGKRLYVAAFETATGRDMTDAVEPTGRTELAIFGETLERHGIEPSDELRRRYAAELARQYEEHADELRTVGRALPGARAVLAALAEQAMVVQTVLTGNLRAVAATKLRVFGLDEYVDWAVGAYGEDASERAELVAIGQERAANKYGGNFNRDNTVIIGDTAQDVNAAHEGGARIIAVASGRDTADDLQRAGADTVLPDLLETACVLSSLTDSPEI